MKDKIASFSWVFLLHFEKESLGQTCDLNKGIAAESLPGTDYINLLLVCQFIIITYRHDRIAGLSGSGIITRQVIMRYTKYVIIVFHIIHLTLVQFPASNRE